MDMQAVSKRALFVGVSSVPVAMGVNAVLGATGLNPGAAITIGLVSAGSCYAGEALQRAVGM